MKLKKANCSIVQVRALYLREFDQRQKSWTKKIADAGNGRE